MEWFEISDTKDAQNLLYQFGGFHDGCLKELRYISGEYVNEKLSMMAVNTQRRLSVIFQRQWKNPRAIEIVFEGLIRMNLAPSIPHNDGIIYHAYLDVIDGKVYWGDGYNFDVSRIDSDPDYQQCTWIIAEKAKWRVADDYIGNEEIYINRK